jgi:hypothetical protein
LHHPSYPSRWYRRQGLKNACLEQLGDAQRVLW